MSKKLLGIGEVYTYDYKQVHKTRNVGFGYYDPNKVSTTSSTDGYVLVDGVLSVVNEDGSRKPEPTPPTTNPFDVVPDDKKSFTYDGQMSWKNALSDANISTAYCSQTSTASNSMLYRKVDVLSDVTISSYLIDTNQQATLNIANNRALYPSCEILYDMNLNSAQIFETTGTFGSIYRNYQVLSPNGSYTWYVLSAECNVTLHAGETWWWPMVMYRHNSIGSTNFGFNTGVSSEMLALRNYNNTADIDYPPQVFTADYRPWLVLNDTNGNSWSV